jgi:tetratricopeptide (TPR) repeat protein
MHISAFALEPGDVVIVGSDGRDDIQLGVDSKGHRIINEDEYEFLRHVESGVGDLEKIEASILGRGDLTDDFTLIRVGYRVDESLEFLERRKDERERLAKQIGAALEAGEAARGLTALEAYFERFPESSEHLFAAARLARACGRLALARDYAERLRLREPQHVENLILLAELCLALHDLERAVKIAGEALEIEPANPRARELAARSE